MAGQKGVIILIRDDEMEAWGSIAEMCRNHPEISYSYLSTKTFTKDNGFRINYINRHKKTFKLRKLPYRKTNGV